MKTTSIVIMEEWTIINSIGSTIKTNIITKTKIKNNGNNGNNGTNGMDSISKNGWNRLKQSDESVQIV